MKRSTNDEEARPTSVGRTQHHNGKSSHHVAGPSSLGQGTSTSIPAYPNNKKHGFGLGRFSLRRIFSPSSLGRTTTATRPHRTFKDMHSETTGSTIDKSNLSAKPSTTTRAAGSSSDAESYSISSCRSEYLSSGQMVADVSHSLVECPLCLLEQPNTHFPELSSCTHRACHRCLQQYLKIEISESRVNIHCPECTEPLHPNDIQKILNYDTNLLEKYESFMLRRILVTEPDARWCPAPDCGFVVIASGCASCPKLKCGRPGCETSFCYHCKQEWHPNQTCDSARAQRSSRHSPNAKSSSVSFSHDSIVQRDDIKPCPCCKVPIIKMDDGSCNHMTCSVCGTEFCWLCMKEISDLHYLSPSGCTFWGKKPWSRKKKIMWQLGMLVGAPVGIALIAGIAVPAIIIGIPVWVGRKLHARFERHQMSKHKRNLLVTTGVLTSIFVSPILAAVAVGIGVPILLAYVYGVVPISLCRSGGCGVTTSASGVRIELDEENEIGISSGIAPDGLSVDTALSNRGVNPSVGELSLGMSASVSMGTGSGSHLDRLAAADRENASIAACAGSIASGNISLGVAQKVEYQTDACSNKRFSLSSHSETASATLSFGERSANLSLMDDASVKALAGSIGGHRDLAVAYNNVTPVEVHVDAIGSLNVPNKLKDDEFQHIVDAEPLELNNRSNNDFVPYNFIDYCGYIDEASSQGDQTERRHDRYSKTEVPRLIKASAMGKFESRSLEHLSNYCEICHKTHKPCCPNLYSHQTSTSNRVKSSLSSSQSSTSSKKTKSKCLYPSKDDDHQNTSSHSHQYSFNKCRNLSVKSNNSNLNFDCDRDSFKKLKRIRSIEYQIESSLENKQKKKGFSSVFRSTPTSPVESANFEKTNVIHERAYNEHHHFAPTKTSKRNHKSQLKETKLHAKTNAYEIDSTEKYQNLKSSEV